MKTIRFNLFKRAHQGIRALLADTLIQLQKTDFLISSEATEGVERIKLVLQLVHGQAKLQNNFIFPLLSGEGSSMNNYFTNQHYQNDALTLALDILISNFEEAQTEAEKESTGNSILAAFIEFTSFNLNHMNMEEQLINPLLWCKYSDAELEEIMVQTTNKTAVKHERMFVKWMFLHNTDNEIGKWLGSMKRQMTPAQFDEVFDLAKEVLTPGRLELIHSKI